MHTLAKNQHHNERLCYDFLEKAYPNGMPSFDQLVADNIVNGTQLVELAIAKSGGLNFCPIGYNQDFLDGSDVKTVTMSKDISIKRATLKTGQKKRYKSTVYVAKIADVDKKIGVLRIVCWNPFAEKYQYFRIPASAIFGISKLKISFDSKTLEPVGIYKEYQVDSFDAVSSQLTVKEVIDTIISNVSKQNISEQLNRLVKLIPANIDFHSVLESIKNDKAITAAATHINNMQIQTNA